VGHVFSKISGPEAEHTDSLARDDGSAPPPSARPASPGSQGLRATWLHVMLRPPLPDRAGAIVYPRRFPGGSSLPMPSTNQAFNINSPD